MQVYCGTDIIEVSRIEEAIKNKKNSKKTFIQKEKLKQLIRFVVK